MNQIVNQYRYVMKNYNIPIYFGKLIILVWFITTWVWCVNSNIGQPEKHLTLWKMIPFQIDAIIETAKLFINALI